MKREFILNYLIFKTMSMKITNSPLGTKKLGENLAKKFLARPLRKKALTLALEGGLGGGKTTFLQGFAKGLGIKEKILSPTFLILKRFKIYDLRFKNFYHIDCYRIQKPKEILDLGLKKITQNCQNIVALEWAEKIKKVLPQNTIWVKFNPIGKNTRKILIKYTG